MTGQMSNKSLIVPIRDILNRKDNIVENWAIKLLGAEFTTQDLIII